MTDEVRAMIDAKVRELRSSGRWLVVSGQKKHPQRQVLPRMNTDLTDSRNQDAGRGTQENPDPSTRRGGLGMTNPEEMVEVGYREIKRQVKAELLERIKAASPKFFERLVVELMVRLGYGGGLESSGTVTGRGGDEGIDGVIQQDRLGLDLLYLQAKRWNHEVARAEIQKFVGALHGKRASRGVFVTTSSFGKGAVEFAAGLEGKKVVLIDGERLTELMFESGLGLVTVGTYRVKRVDGEYFS